MEMSCFVENHNITSVITFINKEILWRQVLVLGKQKKFYISNRLVLAFLLGVIKHINQFVGILVNKAIYQQVGVDVRWACKKAEEKRNVQC